MLSETHKRQLRGLANRLRPIVMIGNAGLTDNVLAEIENGLVRHELIKVRIQAGDRKGRDSIIDSICEQTRAQRVQRVGNVMVLYRHNPQHPRIAFD
jgi:RNA-binding protein